MAKQRMLVVGGGVMGLAAAYHLARAGHPVALLEQFAPGHARGSSHGPSRIIRYAYDDPRYVELMAHAYALWHALERDAGRQALWPSGGLDFAPADNLSLRRTAEALAATGTAHELLDAADLRARFPQFRLPPQTAGIYQADAGILAADQIVRLLADEVARLGGEIHAETPALAITPGAGEVAVATPRGEYRAERLVLAAGSWTRELLAPLGIALPLRVQHEQVAFFSPREPAAWSIPAFPVFIDHETWAYGLPVFGGPGVKLAFHGGGPAIDPSIPTPAPAPERLASLQDYVAERLPGLDRAVLSAVSCRYTVTPDAHFVIDELPQAPGVIIASPCSGHGFKFAILVGAMLAELAATGATRYPIDLFRARRLLADPEPLF